MKGWKQIEEEEEQRCAVARVVEVGGGREEGTRRARWEEKRSLSTMTGSEVIVAGEFNVPL